MSNLALPGNPRYQPKELIPYFGYDNLFRFVAEVEIAALKTLGEFGVIPKTEFALLTPEVEHALLTITTTEVDKVEREITKHDIRAWVRLAQEKVDPKLRRWIHLPLTSYDVLDTARSLQFLRAHNRVVEPLVAKVISCLVGQVQKYANTTQIGRTHGQHALPITVGFWLATVLSRIHQNILAAEQAAKSLKGKISGAVGAYNAQAGLGIYSSPNDQYSFEESVLMRLGLDPAPISTQILPPEPLADYLWSLMKLSATFGQFGRDGRNLMRTEIAELGEPFESGQVGSSTMAHKRNPINFENLEGTWLRTKAEFGKVLDTMISDHQRDLVGSSVTRDFPIIVVNVVNQLNTLLRESKGVPFILRILVDEVACEKNLATQSSVILAEPMYIALQMAGYRGDAHELVNHYALRFVIDHGYSLLEATRLAMMSLNQIEELSLFNNIPPEVLKLLSSPEEYIGLATQKAIQIASTAEAYLLNR